MFLLGLQAVITDKILALQEFFKKMKDLLKKRGSDKSRHK